MSTPKERCKDIRDHFYPLDQRPAEIYFKRVMALGGPEAVLVEVGCGRESGFLRRAAPNFYSAYGFDPEIVSPVTSGNIHLAPGIAEKLPLENSSATLVITMDVVEHLAQPAQAFAEFARVLRKGGRILVLTPNIQHPPLFIARPLPHPVRQFLNRLATGTKSEDTFPTFYRANTGRAMTLLAREVGLKVVSLEYVSNHPQYLMFSKMLYRMGVAIERSILAKPQMAFLRQMILCEYEKR